MAFRSGRQRVAYVLIMKNYELFSEGGLVGMESHCDVESHCHPV
jgi:hypothetical protein